MFIFYYSYWILFNFIVQILCNNYLDSVIQGNNAIVIANCFGLPLLLSHKTIARVDSRFLYTSKLHPRQF